MRVCVCLLVLGLGGCAGLDDRPTRWLNQMNPFAGAPGERVVLKTYLLQQPAGDPYLTHELWSQLLRPLPVEKHALLAENGLRVGHLTGNPPYQFLTLARTEDAVVKPMQSIVAVNDPKPVPLNGPLPEVKFQAFVEVGAKPGQFDLKDAEAALNITAATGENGRVKLTLEPRIQHGSRQLGWKPNFDATAFTWLDQKVQERFPSLKCEVSLAPEEFLIVGPSETPANTLGGACFMNVSAAAARMRVLVIQAAPFEDPARRPSGKKAAAIAAQASRPVIRGQQP